LLLTDAADVPDLDGPFKNGNRGVTVFLDLDAVISAANRKHR
jgi:hypothetical protein